MTVLLSLDGLPETAFAQQEAISINPTQGPPGTQVTVTGTGWDQQGSRGIDVPIQISAPGFPTTQVADPTPDPSGNFITTFIVPANVPTGQLTILAIIGDGGSADAWFMVTANAPTVTLQSVSTADSNNNAKTTFAPGGAIRYVAQVTNSGSNTVTATFTFLATGPQQIFSWSGPGPVAAGTEGFYSPSTIPSNAPAGTYTITVTVTYNGQNSTKTNQFTVISASTPTPSPTPTPTPTPMPTETLTPTLIPTETPTETPPPTSAEIPTSSPSPTPPPAQAIAYISVHGVAWCATSFSPVGEAACDDVVLSIPAYGFHATTTPTPATPIGPTQFLEHGFNFLPHGADFTFTNVPAPINPFNPVTAIVTVHWRGGGQFVFRPRSITCTATVFIFKPLLSSSFDIEFGEVHVGGVGFGLLIKGPRPYIAPCR